MAKTKTKAQPEKRPTGRPRGDAPIENPFATWIESKAGQGLAIADIAKDLDLAVSTVYNLRNGSFRPSLDLAIKLDEYTENAVSVYDWAQE